MANLLNLPSWTALQDHFEDIKNVQLRSLFESSDRFNSFSVQFNDILLDYSKNRINQKTMSLLNELAIERGVKRGLMKCF